MIPPALTEPRIDGGKPRASGDDPTILAAILGVAAVNPARAGMIRDRRIVDVHLSSKPRASGDDPLPGGRLEVEVG